MSDDEDKTGYGNPPKKYQFRKGKSGNPNGRPKGKKSLLKQLEEEFSAKITIKENGISKEVSKQTAIIKRLVNEAVLKPNEGRKLLDTVMKLSKHEDELQNRKREKEHKSSGGVLLVQAPFSSVEAYLEHFKDARIPGLDDPEDDKNA